MVDHVATAADSIETEGRPRFHDAWILKNAMRESVLTSPGSFLKTVSDIEAMDADYWEKELGTST